MVILPGKPIQLASSGFCHSSTCDEPAAECHRNVEVIWLLRKLTPDFKTIADFRQDNLKPLKAVHRQFIVLRRKLELFGGELLAIDGRKFRAINARDKNFNASKLKELIAHADARLSLITLAYNLKRVLNLMSLQRLMAAVA
ncbi:MAG: transposase [Akkermansiaceae bacterium]|nr:transposase [Verrucomicrobiales bacterium]